LFLFSETEIYRLGFVLSPEVKKMTLKFNQLNRMEVLDVFPISISTTMNLPLVDGISAGFPSPAQDFVDLSIDLNKELVKHPSATFYGRVKGESMKDRGINDGDLIIIDKSLSPKTGNIAVCYLDGEFTMKTIQMEKGCCWLIPANDAYPTIKVTEDNDFLIWGVVVHVVKSF
jgi:DNA polymerase V